MWKCQKQQFVGCPLEAPKQLFRNLWVTSIFDTVWRRHGDQSEFKIVVKDKRKSTHIHKGTELCVSTKVNSLACLLSLLMDIFQSVVQCGSSAIKWGVLPLLLASQSRMPAGSPGGNWSVTCHSLCVARLFLHKTNSSTAKSTRQAVNSSTRQTQLSAVTQLSFKPVTSNEHTMKTQHPGCSL